MQRLRASLLPALLLILVGTAVYRASLDYPFIYDDRTSIVENPQLRQLWPPRSVFVPTRENALSSRPLVALSFALNYRLGGLEVRGYRAVNLALHLGSALLLFLLIRRTDPSRSRVLIAAAACLAAAPIHWILTARLTQRIFPPITTYLLLLGLLLGAIGFAADARFATWLRVTVIAMVLAILAVALWFWIGPTPFPIAI